MDFFSQLAILFRFGRRRRGSRHSSRRKVARVAVALAVAGFPVVLVAIVCRARDESSAVIAAHTHVRVVEPLWAEPVAAHVNGDAG